MPHHKNYDNKNYVANHNDWNKTHDKHDYVDNGSYKRICDCQKCKKKWDDWCDKRKSEGDTRCKRKCYTICEYECKQPVTTVYEWGHKEKFEGDWESHDRIDRPTHCDKCKQKKHECTCNRKY